MPLFIFMKKVCMYTYKIGISFFVIVSSIDCKSKWRLWRKAHICQWYTIGGSSLQCGDGQHDTHSFLHWKQRNVIFLIVVEWKMKLMFIRGIRQSLLFLYLQNCQSRCDVTSRNDVYFASTVSRATENCLCEHNVGTERNANGISYLMCNGWRYKWVRLFLFL